MAKSFDLRILQTSDVHGYVYPRSYSSKEQMDTLTDKKLSVTTRIYENWFTKKGLVKKVDILCKVNTY